MESMISTRGFITNVLKELGKIVLLSCTHSNIFVNS